MGSIPITSLFPLKHSQIRLIGRNGVAPSWYDGDGWFDPGIRLTVMCGGFQAAAIGGGLAAWAQCWFLVLVMLVVLTVGVLFILALLEILHISRKV